MLSFAGCQFVQVLCIPGSQEKPCKETQWYSLSAASSLAEPFVYMFHITLHKKTCSVNYDVIIFCLVFFNAGSSAELCK